MQHKRLVIDANILIRAVFGTRMRQLIAASSAHVAFYVAEANFEEAERYLGQLAPARGMPEAVFECSVGELFEYVPDSTRAV